jgi:hypothetical protein
MSKPLRKVNFSPDADDIGPEIRFQVACKICIRMPPPIARLQDLITHLETRNYSRKTCDQVLTLPLQQRLKVMVSAAGGTHCRWGLQELSVHRSRLTTALRVDQGHRVGYTEGFSTSNQRVFGAIHV